MRIYDRFVDAVAARVAEKQKVSHADALDKMIQQLAVVKLDGKVIGRAVQASHGRLRA